MQTDDLQRLLEKHLENKPKAEKGETAFHVKDDCDVTVYAALEGETLTIPKVCSLFVGKQIVMLETSRGVRYALPPEGLRAISVFDSKPNNAGFTG